jgi:hypothetical protein
MDQREPAFFEKSVQVISSSVRENLPPGSFLAGIKSILSE